ncbi:MAG: glucose-1-phosphate thymidylyltransferase [Candidatus Bathyarchaeota archaeon]|nr:glucose-1-phosphate thymidylyltransferase [Candidatus Bathyarchaeota archaeon]
MKGVILHGGRGTRLRPLTHTGPKQLIPVANKPISQYVLEDLRNSGVKDIAIILGDVYPEKVKEHYGDGGKFGVRLTYIDQDEPRGIAHAVGLCEEFVGNEDFVVYLGDNLLKGGTKRYAERFVDSECDTMILLCEVKNPQLFGVAKLDKKGRLVGLVEKPKVPPSPYALTGIYFFTPVIFEMIRKLKPSWRGELEITEAIHLLVTNGYNVGHRIVSGWWKDTGSPEDILEANRLVLDELKTETEGTVESESSIQGRVVVGSNSVVKGGALVRGPVIIGENSVVEEKVYIGPYTSIGNNVLVKRGEIENSIIMDGCLIDVSERITDSIIGPNTKITSDDDSKPSGRRFILGESSQITL